MNEKERLIELLIKSEQNCFFCNRYENLDCINECGMREKAKHLADYLIANGVRIPVRCEECVHRQKVININNRSYVSCRHCGEIKEIGDFCKHGEKRDDNERQ